jgi:hypothetical protein
MARTVTVAIRKSTVGIIAGAISAEFEFSTSLTHAREGIAFVRFLFARRRPCQHRHTTFQETSE